MKSYLSITKEVCVRPSKGGWNNGCNPCDSLIEQSHRLGACVESQPVGDGSSKDWLGS